MADYELYLIVLLCMGAVILSALVCIWWILCAGKSGKEHRLFPVPSWLKEEIPVLAPPEELELEEAEPTSALGVEEELVETGLPGKFGMSLEGTRGTILQRYFESMKAVGEKAEISMEPHMTLREFLKEVMPELGDATGAFVELTGLAERALYSPCMPGEEGALRAENLASRVERVIKGAQDV
jgi:hypothetical protein